MKDVFTDLTVVDISQHVGASNHHAVRHKPSRCSTSLSLSKAGGGKGAGLQGPGRQEVIGSSGTVATVSKGIYIAIIFKITKPVKKNLSKR